MRKSNGLPRTLCLIPSRVKPGSDTVLGAWTVLSLYTLTILIRLIFRPGSGWLERFCNW